VTISSLSPNKKSFETASPLKKLRGRLRGPEEGCYVSDGHAVEDYDGSRWRETVVDLVNTSDGRFILVKKPLETDLKLQRASVSNV